MRGLGAGLSSICGDAGITARFHHFANPSYLRASRHAKTAYKKQPGRFGRDDRSSLVAEGMRNLL